MHGVGGVRGAGPPVTVVRSRCEEPVTPPGHTLAHHCSRPPMLPLPQHPNYEEVLGGYQEEKG